MRRRTVAAAAGIAVAGVGVAVAIGTSGGSPTPAPWPHADVTVRPSSSPAMPTKPPLPARTVVRVPWVDTPYDADRPPAFPGSVADPHVPWCRASDLGAAAYWQGATGNLFGGVTVTNTSTRICAVQGQPSVAILDRAGRRLVAADADPFYVEQWVRLSPRAKASTEIDWYGEFCHRPQPHALQLDLPHLGGLLRVPMHQAPPCESESDPAAAGHLQLRGFVRRTAHHLATRFTPEADLDASVGHMQRHVVAGNTLHYRVRLFSLGRGQVQLRPCLPYRERLLSTSGAVVVTQAFRLNCNPVFSQPDTPQSGYVNYYAMRLQVPASLPPGRYALQWQSALEPVQDTAAARVVVTQPPPACTQDQLAITAGRAGVGLGSFYAPVLFRNVSATTCSLRGFPGVEYVAPNGRPMPTRPVRETAVPARTVVLRPGRTASAMLSGSDFGPNGGAVPCPATAGVRVIAPGLVSQVFVQAGVDYCDGGRIFVSAMQPGLRPEP